MLPATFGLVRAGAPLHMFSARCISSGGACFTDRVESKIHRPVVGRLKRVVFSFCNGSAHRN